MALNAGDKLGPYEVVAPLGAGGMGEVYKARDTRLDRSVAVKVLPDHIAQREDARARFEREARAVASLNHPNICTLHDLGPNYMVMELIEGETLAARVEKGAIPLEQAIKLATQIADALDRAHRAGVTHRDVKPHNIMLTRDGVKVLDFGLAKSAPTAPGPTEATLTKVLTTEGTVLGTPQYMAPEQFAGQEADARSDIWALGAVLYEMVTGQKAFQGKNYTSLVAAILGGEPAPMAVKPFTPAWLERLVKRCLQKDPEDRWQSMRDIVLDLKSPPAEVASTPAKPTRWPWAIAAVTILAAIVFGLFQDREPPARTGRYSIVPPEGSRVRSVALSPDGHTLLMADGRQLWLRPMDALEPQPLPFTEGASLPFWSPDSRSIGFFARQKLMRIEVAGGPARAVSEAPGGRGGSWSKNGVIVFSPAVAGALQRVPAAGGSAVPATELDRGAGEVAHQDPWFLPDGRHYLYLARNSDPAKNAVYVADVDSNRPDRDRKAIVTAASKAMYSPPGFLLFLREKTLMAQRFDAGKVETVGDATPIANEVGRAGLRLDGVFSVALTSAGNSALVYSSGSLETPETFSTQIGWVDRTGKMSDPDLLPGSSYGPALSPDGKVVAVRRTTGLTSDLWLRDLIRGTETRLTSEPAFNESAVWSPKGDRIVFASNRRGAFQLYQKAANGTGQDELLIEDGVSMIPTQWSRDGRFLVYHRVDAKSRSDVWVLPLDGAAARKPVPFLRSEFDERYGQLSPDSHWMAFVSDRSGRREVYVRPFPAGEGEYTISVGGGNKPRWRGDGRELFFQGADGKMMSAPVKVTVGAKAAFESGVPTALFDHQLAGSALNNEYEWDVSGDGKRFLINRASNVRATPSPPLTVVTNWQAGLR